MSATFQLIAKVGFQGPIGATGAQGPAGLGFFEYTTTAAMFAVTGVAGNIAHCADNPDQHWKWSTQQNTWVPAF